MRKMLLWLMASMLLLPVSSGLGDWDLDKSAKWAQLPDLDITGIVVNASHTPDDYILADDFLCTETDRLIEIHVFGSWWYDWFPGFPPNEIEFTLSIHDDIPANQNPDGYSIPGVPLWTMKFLPGSFDVQPYAEGIEEGWLDAPNNYIPPPVAAFCWQYSFFIDPALAFLQEGTLSNPVVYWLSLEATPLADGPLFGWMTTLDHWNDNAVWGIGMRPYPGPWWELRYPQGHPMADESIDLAFALFGEDITAVPDVPQKRGLLNNVPNPFNPSTVIYYVMPEGGGDIRIEVFDTRGRLVRSLVDGFVSGGPQTVEWNGRDNRGLDMPSGVYFYRLDGPGGEKALKMLLLR
jgi:hypothetical protein